MMRSFRMFAVIVLVTAALADRRVRQEEGRDAGAGAAAAGPRRRPPRRPPPPPPPPPPARRRRRRPRSEIFAKMTLDELNAKGVLADVFFAATTQWSSTPDARAVLQKNTDYMKRWTTTKVMVEGHADSRGTNEYNLALGERRADAVRDYLVSLGIPTDRITVVSKGEEQPVCREETRPAGSRTAAATSSSRRSRQRGSGCGATRPPRLSQLPLATGGRAVHLLRRSPARPPDGIRRRDDRPADDQVARRRPRSLRPGLIVRS